MLGLELKYNTLDIWHKGNLTPHAVATSGNYNDLNNKPTSLPASSASSAVITTGLGFTPYNATNPAGYITIAQAAVQSVAGRTGAVVLAKADVGLGSVDNTTDANKPVSTAQLTALNGKVDDAQVLTNVPAGAKFTDTVYSHPANHPASVITQDTSNRFVTDTEKGTWNGKANGSHTHTKSQITDMPTALSQFTNDAGYVTSAGSGAKIATNSVAPSTPGPGDFWYKIV